MIRSRIESPTSDGRVSKASSSLSKDTKVQTVKPDEDRVEMGAYSKGISSEPALPFLLKWNFGEGREGVFLQPTGASERVLVVGQSIPWWGMVVARLNLRIH
jgi:hypothetical protein